MSGTMTKLQVGDASFVVGNPRETGLDNWLRGLLRSENPPSRRPHLYGADAGKCVRLNVLHAYNETVPFTTNDTSAAYMAIGDALEGMLATALHRARRLIFSNYRLLTIPEVKISGKIDLVFQDHLDQLAISEVKSCGALPSEPKWGHVVQAQTYAAVSGFDLLYLTYVSRNVQAGWGTGLAMKTFVLDTSREVLQQRLQTAVASRLAISRGILPAIPSWFRKSSECSFCPYTPICWDGLIESPVRRATQEEEEWIDQEAERVASRLMDTRLERHIQTLNHLAIETSCNEQVPVIKARLKELIS